MNHIRCYVLFAVLFTASASRAYLPESSLPLAERVKMSSHIFVGEIQEVYFISTSGKRITPRQAAQQMNYLWEKFARASRSDRKQSLDHLISSLEPVVETKIKVTEVLLWRTDKPEQVIRFRGEVPSAAYHPGKHRAKRLIENLRRDEQDVGKKFVFLTNMVAQRGRRTYFASSYGPFHCEEMKQKTAVQKAILFTGATK